MRQATKRKSSNDRHMHTLKVARQQMQDDNPLNTKAMLQASQPHTSKTEASQHHSSQTKEDPSNLAHSSSPLTTEASTTKQTSQSAPASLPMPTKRHETTCTTPRKRVERSSSTIVDRTSTSCYQQRMNFLKGILWTMMNLASKLFEKVMKYSPQSLKSISTSRRELLNIRDELEKFEGGSVDLEMDEDTGIAVMTLNNPKKLNSMTGRMMVEMADQITHLEQWKTGKGVIVMGANGNFCSGGDLTFVRKALHYGSEMAAFQHDTLTRLLNLPLLSVALIQGHTLGGGAELSTACDFRVMSSTAKIGFVQIKMGLTTGWGAATRLVHLLGRQKTLALLSSAKVMNSEEAQKEGLVDHLVSCSSAEEELTECKRWLVSNYCRHEADLLQAVKSLIVSCDLNRDLESSLRHERQIFAKYWGGPKQKAALDARIKHK